jgi:hypothetical protein
MEPDLWVKARGRAEVWEIVERPVLKRDKLQVHPQCLAAHFTGAAGCGILHLVVCLAAGVQTGSIDDNS